MTIKAKVLGEDGELTEAEQDDAAEQARQEAEAARKEELDALKEKAHSEELARAKAEGELNALRGSQQQTQSAPQWSDEQWETEAQKYGTTGANLKLQAAIQSQNEQKQKSLEAKIAAAEAKAEAAEKRANELSRNEGGKRNLSDFYESNPQFAGHKKDVEEFVGMFPESDRSDPKKLAVILDKAKTYVKGKVGVSMKNKTGSEGSARLGGGFNEEPETPEIDFTGLDDRNLRRDLEEIAYSVQDKLSDKERLERFKKASSSDGRGVRHDFEAQFKAEESRRKNRA